MSEINLGRIRSPYAVPLPANTLTAAMLPAYGPQADDVRIVVSKDHARVTLTPPGLGASLVTTDIDALLRAACLLAPEVLDEIAQAVVSLSLAADKRAGQPDPRQTSAVGATESIHADDIAPRRQHGDSLFSLLVQMSGVRLAQALLHRHEMDKSTQRMVAAVKAAGILNIAGARKEFVGAIAGFLVSTGIHAGGTRLQVEGNGKMIRSSKENSVPAHKRGHQAQQQRTTVAEHERAPRLDLRGKRPLGETQESAGGAAKRRLVEQESTAGGASQEYISEDAARMPAAHRAALIKSADDANHSSNLGHAKHQEEISAAQKLLLKGGLIAQTGQGVNALVTSSARVDAEGDRAQAEMQRANQTIESKVVEEQASAQQRESAAAEKFKETARRISESNAAASGAMVRA